MRQHREGVPEDVLVVRGRLRHSVQGGKLGENHGQSPGLVQQKQVLRTCGVDDDAMQLVADPLRGHPRQPGCVAAHQLEGAGLDREIQLGCQPRRTQDAQGVIDERGVADGAQPALPHACGPAGWVDQLGLLAPREAARRWRWR